MRLHYRQLAVVAVGLAGLYAAATLLQSKTTPRPVVLPVTHQLARPSTIAATIKAVDSQKQETHATDNPDGEDEVDGDLHGVGGDDDTIDNDNEQGGNQEQQKHSQGSDHDKNSKDEAVDEAADDLARLGFDFPESPEPKPKELVVGVLTDPNSLRSTCMAAFTTWVHDLMQVAKVYFFIGSCEYDAKDFPGQLVCLDTPDTYPPQKKVFMMWKWMYEHELHNFQWFMKVDHDSYVNVRRVRQLVHALSSGQQRFRRSYIGKPVTGREGEREKLGLNGARYCLGLGYMVNFLTLGELGKHLDECLQHVVSNHSDTEMGRCIHQHTGIQCQGARGFDFKQVYYQQDGNVVYPMTLRAGGQMQLTFPREPKATHFSAALVHPLKHAADFYRFHKQSTAHLRPVQPSISKQLSNRESYDLAIDDLRFTCVNNPVRQKETMHYSLPECGTPQAQDAATFPTDAAVLVGSEDSEWFAKTKFVLELSNIAAEPIVVPDGWQSGSNDVDHQQAYLETLLALFTEAAREKRSRRLFLVDEEVVFACHFSKKFWSLLNSPRCGGHLFTDVQGGVLLLGTEEVGKAGWDQMESDRSTAFAENHHNEEAALCYNSHRETAGMLAAIFHRNTYGEVINWLAKRVKERKPEEFHGVLGHLSDKGYIVRAAFPNLVARHPNKNTRYTNQNADVHKRWYSSEKYCQPKNSDDQQ